MANMKLNPKTFILIGACVGLMACSLSSLFDDPAQKAAQTVEAKVQSTLTAMAVIVETDAPTATSTPDLTSDGTLSGQLSYPSDYLPPQRIVAFDVDDPNSYYITEVTSGSTYTLAVPPGTYFVLAYLIDPQGPAGIAGAYSQAVLCGLQAGCDDHSLVPVVVPPGETVAGIDPADWYLPPEQQAFWPADPIAPEPGSISGKLGFPSEYIPPLRVVAFDVESESYYYVDTLRNQAQYQITGLPPGTYHVVAYVRDEGPEMAGAYSVFVTCGQTVACIDHNLIAVEVFSGQETTGVDPIDFYAQPGEADWPDNPAP